MCHGVNSVISAPGGRVIANYLIKIFGTNKEHFFPFFCINKQLLCNNNI